MSVNSQLKNGLSNFLSCMLDLLFSLYWLIDHWDINLIGKSCFGASRCIELRLSLEDTNYNCKFIQMTGKLFNTT